MRLARIPDVNAKSLGVALALGVYVFIPITLGLPFLPTDFIEEYCPALNSLTGFGWTEYSPDYTESAFREIRPGMSTADVSSSLGEPLSRFSIPEEPGIEGWQYARTPNDSSYHVRTIHFRNGTVSSVIRTFYID